MRGSRQREIAGPIWVALAVAVATAVTLPQAVHIDDTAYLEVAAWIADEPLRPLSGVVSWNDGPEPIHRINQPPLLSYVLAPVLAWSGGREPWLHLAHALFTVLAGLSFYRLVRDPAGGRAGPLTALFLLGPHSLPGQNLMTDGPMMALWLASLAAVWGPVRRPVVAGLLAGGAVLTKYTALVAIPVLAGVGWLRQRQALVRAALVAIAVVAAWSLFNLLDYGGVHLLGRSGGLAVPGPDRVAAWLIVLGAVSPFSLLAVPALWRTSHGRVALGVATVTVGATLVAGPTIWGDGWSRIGLRAMFLGHGLWTATSLALLLIAWARRAPDDDRWRLVAGTAVGAAVFVIALAPFLAVRHLLPVTTVWLIVIGQTGLTQVPRALWGVTVALTLGLGGALAVTDAAHADVYRREAGALRSTLGDGRVYFLGRWGWQWYATRAGLTPYDPSTTQLREGDLVVVPRAVVRQPFAPGDRERLVLVETRPRWPTPETGLRTMTPRPAGGSAGGYYSSGVRTLPWVVGDDPVEHFDVLRCCRPAP